MESQIVLKRTRFDDDQAVALAGTTVKLTNAALTPALEQLNTHIKQLQSLKADMAELKVSQKEMRTDVAELKVSQKETTQIVGDLRADLAELKSDQKYTDQTLADLKTGQREMSVESRADPFRYCRLDLIVKLIGFPVVIAAIIGSAVAIHFSLI